MQWDLYCRVVDNFGDIGVAWRLAADLAGRGETVRLFADDARALGWMAPHGAAGIAVHAWHSAEASCADVVIELFGAGLPDAVSHGVALASRPPVCINVEHLTAETFAARSHRLPSPRPAANGGTTTTWFFYPGFESGTGGLLREPGLLAARARFEGGPAWLAAQGITAVPGERLVSLFCYGDSAVAELVDALAPEPTLLLLTPGHARTAAEAVLGPSLRRGRVRAAALPHLDQPGFDRLLWSCALNLVRGEDSAVRAVWAGAPFLWQLYRQDDGAEVPKLEAYLSAMLHGASPALARMLGAAFREWNQLSGARGLAEALAPAAFTQWQAHAAAWRQRLAAQDDLASQLIEFARARR